MKIRCTACGMILDGFPAMKQHAYEHMEIEFALSDLEGVESDFPILFLPMEEE